MERKILRLVTWHLLPAGYLVVLSGAALMLLPFKPMGMDYAVDPLVLGLQLLIVVGVGWAFVSGGALLRLLRRQRGAGEV